MKSPDGRVSALCRIHKTWFVPIRERKAKEWIFSSMPPPSLFFFNCLVTYSFLLQTVFVRVLSYASKLFRFTDSGVRWAEAIALLNPRPCPHPSFQLEEGCTLTEGAHELRASLRPPGSIGNSRPAIVRLMVWSRGCGAVVLTATAGAVIVTSRRALGVRGAAPTAAAHLLDNVHLSPQLWNKRQDKGQHIKPSINSKLAKPIATWHNWKWTVSQFLENKQWSPRWCSRLRIRHCQCYGMGSIPSPEISTCRERGQKTNKQNDQNPNQQTKTSNLSPERQWQHLIHPNNQKSNCFRMILLKMN